MKKKELWDSKILENTKQWVIEFNEISSDLIQKAYENNKEDLIELTKPEENCVVWSKKYENDFVITEVYPNEQCAFAGDVKLTFDDIAPIDFIPKYLPCWTFRNPEDNFWVLENLKYMSQNNFRVFQDRDTKEIFISITSGSGNWYKQYWYGLYKKRFNIK